MRVHRSVFVGRGEGGGKERERGGGGKGDSKLLTSLSVHSYAVIRLDHINSNNSSCYRFTLNALLTLLCAFRCSSTHCASAGTEGRNLLLINGYVGMVAPHVVASFTRVRTQLQWIKVLVLSSSLCRHISLSCVWLLSELYPSRCARTQSKY